MPNQYCSLEPVIEVLRNCDGVHVTLNSPLVALILLVLSVAKAIPCNYFAFAPAPVRSHRSEPLHVPGGAPASFGLP